MTTPDYVTVSRGRRVGITVDVGDGEVRPIWRTITIEWPDGEVTAAEWDILSRAEKQAFLDGADL